MTDRPHLNGAALPPWRRETRNNFPGVPAWGVPTSSQGPEPFAISPLADVTGDWAWGGADGSGVRVAILDSGVEGRHPLVGGVERAVGVRSGEDGELFLEDVPALDDAGHGTACASLIHALAPKAALTSVQVLTNGQHGTGAALIAGLTWAIDEGYDVINMSLSTTRPQFLDTLRELSDRAYFRRTVIVASAHNMPVRSYPWPFPSVISVASHDEPDPMTYYYNPSPPVEFYARGVRVKVAWPRGREITSTGNSFAAPHIAGICALILSKHPMLTPFQLKSVLYLAAKNVRRAAAEDVGSSELVEAHGVEVADVGETHGVGAAAEAHGAELASGAEAASGAGPASGAELASGTESASGTGPASRAEAADGAATAQQHGQTADHPAPVETNPLGGSHAE